MNESSTQRKPIDAGVFWQVVQWQQAHNGAAPTVQEVADKTGMAVSSVHRSLKRLIDEGVMTQHREGARVVVAHGQWTLNETVTLPDWIRQHKP